MVDCEHPTITCINPYELIRKYRCSACGEVMMCRCEEEFARRFLPHQLSEGTELNTRRSIPVTVGFQENICNACRGLPEKAHPMAEIYGRSSKVVRYYWREIFFETTKRFASWAEDQGYSYEIAQTKHRDKYRAVEKSVVEEIKDLHDKTPKYMYHEKPQSEVLKKNEVKIVRLDATYVKQAKRKARISEGGKLYTSEEFAKIHYEEQGYQVLFTESIPFHAIFGIFMWLLIQDPTDPEVQIVMFGNRTDFEDGKEYREVWTHLPQDFGTSGYALRRASAIEEHFNQLSIEKEGMLWTFDYWIEPSEKLRQYLWAHRSEDVEKARKIVSILPVEVIHRILRYLIRDYWRSFTGWPDLLVYKSSGFIFVEVKSSKDKLSEDQKDWIEGNSSELHLPFELVKIHRINSQNARN